MRAIQLTGVNALKISDVAEPQAAAGEVVVGIRAAALNHRDLWIKLGQYAGLKWPCIPGSDGAGVVVAVGPGVDAGWVGRDIIINPSLDWGSNPDAQGSNFSILGLPREGTLAEKVSVPVTQLTPKPAHLSWEEAAALPLGGLTAWRAIVSRAGVLPEDRVLITGIGGGVALLALLFSVTHGAEVWVTSSSADKIARAVKLGAKDGQNYSEAGWAPALLKKSGGFNVIIDSAGGDGFGDLIDLTLPGGRLVCYGATRGNPSALTLRKIFWRQLSVLGSTMGTPGEFASMAQYVTTHRLKPIVSDVFPFDRGAEAFDLMERGGQFGKIVVKMSG
ncbi:MAG: Alcohol dehydrogenase zinc-binding domain protein [Verrucomicrobia bacterium]|nr:Alcohol dehydrogenase zinc-binding domain protein [Verrucomicrobiota bacterium]